MKILHLASEYPPQKVFGLGRFVRDLAEEQVRQGHEVTVITNSMNGRHHASCQGGVKVLRVDHPPPPKPPLVTSCVLVFNILVLRRALELGAGAGALGGFEVVCSHDWLTAPAAQAIQEAFGPAHVCTFHDVIIGKRLGKLHSPTDRFTAQVERWAAKAATHVIANSSATKQELVEHYGAGAEKISVVPCAIAPETFSISGDPVRLSAFRDSLLSPDELMVLYVGRLDPEKGVDVLLQAFKRADLPNARLFLAGEGVLRKELQERVKSSGLQNRIEFLGYVANPALAHLYRCADIQVCPSLYEPFGMVALEAMLQGTPVIASSTGGLADLVEDGVTGRLAPPGDVSGLAQALRELSRDRAACQRMGARARKSVLKKRTWATACRQTTGLYQGLHPAARKKTPAARKSLFVSTEGGTGEGYSSGRLTKRLHEEIAAGHENIAQIGAGKNPVLPLRGIDRRDDWIIKAFNAAAKLIRHAPKRPEQLVCGHWSGVLAASVLKKSRGDLALRYFSSRLPSEDKNGGEPARFDREICLWAAREAAQVLVPDAETKAAFQACQVAGEVTTFPSLELPAPEIADAQLLRSCLAGADEKIAVIALRLEPPFAAKSFLAAVGLAAQAGLPIRWIVCGDGPLLPSLKAACRKRSLPVSFTGYLPDTTLGSIFSVADVALVPLEKACHTHFIHEAEAFSLPLVAPPGTASLARNAGREIHEVEFSHPQAVLGALARVLDLPLATPPMHQTAHGGGPIQERDVKQEAALGKVPEQLVLYNDWGIGDELLLSAVAREIKRQYRQTRVWIRSRHGFRFPHYCEKMDPPHTAKKVEAIYQNPELYGPKHHAPFPGHLVQQMLDKVALDTGIQVKARNVRPEVQLPPLPERDANTIVLHSAPNPRLPSKDWGVNRWRRLCEHLYQRGHRLVQVGAASEPRLPHVEDLRKTPVAEIPEIAAQAGLVVCLVGFLMHVAAATNTPAIIIYGGREHPAIDGYPGHIHLCSDPLPCRGRWGCHLPVEAECPHGMRCMDRITPELVEGLVGTMLIANLEGASR